MRRIFVTISLLLYLCGAAWAAELTSVQSGALNNSVTWGGSVPVDGDTLIISSGHTVTVTESATVGSNTGTKHGITINATDATTYGKLVINDGVTLTVRGVSRTYYAIKINRYAVFEPQPGAILSIISPTDGATGVLVEGIVNAIGTNAKPITFTVPAASVNWNVDQGALTLPTASTLWPWNADRQIACVSLPKPSSGATKIRISNAAGTAGGSFSDSSLIISSRSPATIMQTEVATLDEVNAVGEYYVDYAAGFIYFYHAYADSNPSFSVTFKYLDDNTTNWRGWFFEVGAGANHNVTYNEAKFQYCVFEYLGSMGGTRKPVINVGYKKSSALEANRLFFVKNSTFRWCGPPIWFTYTNLGTAADPLLIDSNTFIGNEYAGTDTGGIGITFAISTTMNNHEYVNITNNLIYQRNFIDGGGTWDHTISGVTMTGFKINNNKHYSSVSMLRDFHPPCTNYYDTEIIGNEIYGVGNSDVACRALLDIRGTSGHPVVIRGNKFYQTRQGVVVNKHAVVDRNDFRHNYDSAIIGGSGYVGHAVDIVITNNFIYGLGTQKTTAPSYYTYNKPSINFQIPAVGYWQWLDNVVVANNTIVNYLSGCIGFGNLASTSNSVVVVTKMNLFNNILVGGDYAFKRKQDGTSQRVRGALATFDSNITYGQTTGTYDARFTRQATFVKNGGNYNTLTSGKNIAGVELWKPTYVTKQTSGRTLTYNYTSPADIALQWDAGTPVQIVANSGALTANAANSEYSWYIVVHTILTDSGKSWPTAMTDTACPTGKLLKITSGVAAGSVVAIMANTATTLTVCPPLPSLPSIDDTYIIYESEIALDDGGGNSINAGIDPRLLPSSSQSDTDITVDWTNLTSNPALINASGTTVNDFKTASNAPGVNAGLISALVTTDFFNTERGSAPDIGAYEYYSGGITIPNVTGLPIDSRFQNFDFSLW